MDNFLEESKVNYIYFFLLYIKYQIIPSYLKGRNTKLIKELIYIKLCYKADQEHITFTLGSNDFYFLFLVKGSNDLFARTVKVKTDKKKF